MSKLMSSPKRLKKDLGMLNLTVNNSVYSQTIDEKQKLPNRMSASPEVMSLKPL
jgi:hypothetical protein